MTIDTPGMELMACIIRCRSSDVATDPSRSTRSPSREISRSERSASWSSSRARRIAAMLGGEESGQSAAIRSPPGRFSAAATSERVGRNEESGRGSVWRMRSSYDSLVVMKKYQACPGPVQSGTPRRQAARDRTSGADARSRRARLGCRRRLRQPCMARGLLGTGA